MLANWNYYSDYQHSVVNKLYQKKQNIVVTFFFILIFLLLISYLFYYINTSKSNDILTIILGSIAFFVVIDCFYLCCFLPFCRNIIHKISFYNQNLSLANSPSFEKLKNSNDKNSIFLFLPHYVDQENDDGLEYFKKSFRHKFWQALALTKETSKDRFALASIRTFGFLIMQVFYILVVMVLYLFISISLLNGKQPNTIERDISTSLSQSFLNNTKIATEKNISTSLSQSFLNNTKIATEKNYKNLYHKYISLFIYVFIFFSIVIFIYYFKIIMIFKHGDDYYFKKHTSLSRLELKVYEKTNLISEDIVIKRLAIYTQEANKLIEHYVNFIGAVLLVTLLTTSFIKL